MEDPFKHEELGGRRANHHRNNIRHLGNSGAKNERRNWMILQRNDRREFRGRTNKKQHKKKSIVVVGKVYAEWCGHCQMLKPEWIKMKTHIHTKRGNKHIAFAEIEEKEIEMKLRKLEKDHGVKIEANGYPTLFRIENGHVKYYNGERTSNKMMDWFLKGGDGVISPTPVIQQMGGKYRHNTHRKYYNSRRHHRGFRHTRKNRPIRAESSSKGLLGFLFGK